MQEARVNVAVSRLIVSAVLSQLTKPVDGNIQLHHPIQVRTLRKCGVNTRIQIKRRI